MGDGQPLIGGVTENGFDLGANVVPPAMDADFRDVGDGVHLFDEHAVLRFGFGAGFLRALAARDVAANPRRAAIGHGRNS